MDFAVKGQQHSEKKFHVMLTKPMHAEEDTKFQPNHKCGKSSAPHVGCKTRWNLNLLTEDQKEARRFRRMLANRESARQTILRRQARCEELAKKAAELECENEILKKEKEVAMKKCESLKITNESLKAQLTLNGVMVNVEVEETQEGLKFDNAHTPPSTSTRTQQLHVCNQPSSLPYITPSSNSVQSAPQNGIVCTSKIPVMTNVKTSSPSEYENPTRMNVSRIPFALPYTRLFPLYYFANGVPPQSLALADKHKVTNESSTCSFRKPVADLKYDQRYPLKMIRGEASTSTEIIGPSVHVYCGKASGNKLAHKQKVTSTEVTDGSSERNKETVIGLNARQTDAIKWRNDGSLLRRQMDASRAVAARKKRKEVIKMKNFHYSRQSHVKISSI